MSDPFISIIMRSYNEGWALRETLPALKAQEYKNWELIVIDSGSTDGSVEMLCKAQPSHFVQIKHENYNPSRVMNMGMELARSEFGIFLNADATPQGSNWLRPLVEALQNPQVAAVFGKQIPRPDCQAVFAHDYDRCFGEQRESTQWDHFFSMVSSGLRKDIWAKRGFLEKMQYSEDDEYTRWCRAQGYGVIYIPDSVVMHSHNYTPQQAYKRSFGEAKALAAVWEKNPSTINWQRTVFLGWLNDTRRDLKFCARTNRLTELPHAARIRWEQRRAKLDGFREGWKFYRNGGNGTPSTRSASLEIALPNQSQAERALGAPRKQRFTLDGNDALEKRLDQLCQKVLAEVQSLIPSHKLEALVLGGGYGRGQGGVLKTADGDQSYNDLEFYVFLRGNRVLNERRYHRALQQLGERISPEAGLHVEFKVDSLARLRKSPVTMFSYDLVSGHRVLWTGAKNEKHRTSNIEHPTPNEANADNLDVERSMLNVRCSPPFSNCKHHLDAGNIPLSEATRLLFNRCTGLLLAKELLNTAHLTTEQADFIGRNLAKAQLALGDTVLCALGQYHWSCLERRERLKQLALNWNTEHPLGQFHDPILKNGPSESSAFQSPSWFTEVRKHHAAGVEFKLHPQQILKSLEEFQEEHRELSALALKIWLWIENRRLNQQFSSAHDYAFNPIAKCNGTPVWRNLLLNVKTFGVPSLFGGLSNRYPRERLLNSLALLLWDEPKDLRVRRHLQNQLRTTASDWQSFVTAYKSVWPSFS
ncbi:MAG: hypothetical protein QOD03_698 [Verrucomicrobiota bacterium]